MTELDKKFKKKLIGKAITDARINNNYSLPIFELGLGKKLVFQCVFDDIVKYSLINSGVTKNAKKQNKSDVKKIQGKNRKDRSGKRKTAVKHKVRRRSAS